LTEAIYSRRERWNMAAGIGIVVLALVAASWLVAPDKANPGFKDAASVLAFAGLVAVAIERVIEGALALLAGPFGEWWPLRVAKQEFDVYEKQTNELLSPVFEKVKASLEQAKQQAGGDADKIKKITAAIAALAADQSVLMQQYNDARTKLAPGSARLKRVAQVGEGVRAAFSTAADEAGDLGQDAQTALDAATHAADGALLIIGSFGDNPARRLATMAIGASLGAVVAGGMGLNLFAAVLATDPGAAAAATPAWLLGKVGVLATGLIVGLGSNPTHEVIKALQQYKDSRIGGEDVPASGSLAARGRERLSLRASAMEQSPSVSVRRTG
jgi:hypothetical protein